MKEIDFTIIVCTPHTLGGAPRLKNRRISVFDIVNHLASGITVEEYSNEFEVSENYVLTALHYCQKRFCIINNPENFCFGCTLYSMKKNETFDEFSKRLGITTYIDNIDDKLEDNSLNLIGNRQDLLEYWQGVDGWSLARNILDSI